MHAREVSHNYLPVLIGIGNVLLLGINDLIEKAVSHEDRALEKIENLVNLFELVLNELKSVVLPWFERLH